MSGDMALNFFDTSALAKHYHPETGTQRVDQLLAAAGDRHAISRLSVVEMHSVFAKKVRAGAITLADYQIITRRFRSDVAAKKLRVVRMLVAHFQLAEQLIRRIGPVRNLRTLDAIQLATALRLNEPANPLQFICSDQALCDIAAAEGLIAVNPEIP